MANFTYKLPHPMQELTMSDMVSISQFYEAACTAEYILDNLEQFGLPADMTEDVALHFGWSVRHMMDKYGSQEEECIQVLAKDYRKKEQEE